MQRLLLFAVTLVCIMTTFAGRSEKITALASEQTYWPTLDWKSSTPEQQGMDSATLVKLFDFIQEKGIRLHSLLIVRHGYVVTEAYSYPYNADHVFNTYSVTKSVTSALIGMALDRGLIDGLDHKILDYFPGQTFENTDNWKRSITVENLLTMSSGLEWPELASDHFIADWLSQPNWINYALDQPVTHRPGKTWNYNTGGVHVLSAIFQKAAGQRLSDFAQEHLFKPIGITSALWPTDPTGVTAGGMSLQLTARDMARFGALYLHQGEWDGQQIIPADWVKVSTQKRFEAVYDQDYGYLWWIQRFGAYAANGYGGQRIFVVPDQDLIVVMTAALDWPEMMTLPESLLRDWILPAVKAADPLPDNAQGDDQLAARTKAVNEGPAR